MENNNKIVYGVIVGIIVFIALLMVVLPQYGVWNKTLRGKAQLKEAEWNRQIAVQEAEAKKQSATLLAEAEVERAKGVSKANQIISEGLKGNDEYLRYLWIQTLENSEKEIIYVPTEANLPILEAGKR